MLFYFEVHVRYRPFFLFKLITINKEVLMGKQTNPNNSNNRVKRVLFPSINSSNNGVEKITTENESETTKKRPSRELPSLGNAYAVQLTIMSNRLEDLGKRKENENLREGDEEEYTLLKKDFEKLKDKYQKKAGLEGCRSPLSKGSFFDNNSGDDSDNDNQALFVV